MFRHLGLFLLALPGIASAADPGPEARKLTLSPAAAPRPALRFELLPRLRDSKPGNRALQYAWAFELRPAPMPDKTGEREKRLAAWQEGPIDALPLKEVKEHLQTYADTLKTYTGAAHLDRYESETLPRLRADGINTLLPSVQLHREVVRQLALRHRVELAEGRFEDAIQTLQVLFRSAKDVGEDPTLIQMLVGLAISSTAIQEIEHWVQRPDSPNLYWALTALPRPLIDPRPGLEGESVFFDTTLPNIKEIEKGPLSVSRADEILAGMFSTLEKLQNSGMVEGATNSGDAEAALKHLAFNAAKILYVTTQYEGAKKYLIEDGMKPDVVAKMAPAQVVALRSIRRIRGLFDDQFKCFLLPIPQGRAEFAKLGDETKKARDENSLDLLFVVALMMSPAMERAHESHARIERKLAALRTLEAIRLHASANGGQLPKALADVTALFVPGDPVTGKPFEYSVNGKSFTLIGPAPNGVKPDQRNSIHYQVTMR